MNASRFAKLHYSFVFPLFGSILYVQYVLQSTMQVTLSDQITQSVWEIYLMHAKEQGVTLVKRKVARVPTYPNTGTSDHVHAVILSRNNELQSQKM